MFKWILKMWNRPKRNVKEIRKLMMVVRLAIDTDRRVAV